VLYEHKYENTSALLSRHAYYDSKYLLLAFEKGSDDFYIVLFDAGLNELRTKKIAYEFNDIYMSESKFYLLRANSKEKLINEYDYDFHFINSYGQSKRKKKKFFIEGSVFAIENDKVYTKYENTVSVLAKASGNVLHQFDLDDLITSRIFLDFDKEKFLVFNGYQKLSYYNHSGELVNFNKIRVASEKFDEFQFIKSGYFAFINNQKNLILII
jgi:hypothetical protein